MKQAIEIAHTSDLLLSNLRIFSQVNSNNVSKILLKEKMSPSLTRS